MSKEVFVKNFSDFLLENVPYFQDMKSLVYKQDEDGEWMYCNYKSYSQKRINIAGDSEYGIMTDFFNNIEKSDWVLPIDEEAYGG